MKRAELKNLIKKFILKECKQDLPLKEVSMKSEKKRYEIGQQQWALSGTINVHISNLSSRPIEIETTKIGDSTTSIRIRD